MRLFFAAAFITLLSTSIAAQRASSPRTPWGDPDLHGTYTHEGNYGLRNILSAARAEERQRAR